MCARPRSNCIRPARLSASPSPTCCRTSASAANSGYTATSVASLFTGPALFWTVAANATQPVFDGFTLLHLERASRGGLRASGLELPHYGRCRIPECRRFAARDPERCRHPEGGARVRKGRQDQPRPDATAAANRPGQHPASSHTLSRPMSRPCSRSSRPRPRASATPRRCSRPWEAAGGTGSARPRRSKNSMSRPGKSTPVVDDSGWLSVITDKALSSRTSLWCSPCCGTSKSPPSQIPNPHHRKPPAHRFNWSTRRTIISVAAANLAGEGGKP